MNYEIRIRGHLDPCWQDWLAGLQIVHEPSGTTRLAGSWKLTSRLLRARFNMAPVLEGKGLNLLLDTNHYQYKDVPFLEVKSLGGGVVQLRYALGHE